MKRKKKKDDKGGGRKRGEGTGEDWNFISQPFINVN